ncbi:MAG: hypothetical protein CMH62_01535 [Nanoarchaeota archaeon]|jgi:hypothetical protein|nr:hypothetical protein [Nanoarchaeota archaeon]|tara:strand:- start:10618 stop:10860 length:243 start_codon:yes stop_codon:yes gene_type:complete
MKAKVLYVSQSGKSASVAVDQKMGDIVQSTTGFINLAEGLEPEIGDELNIPNATIVSTVTSEVTDEETGEVISFTWLRFA